MATVKLTPEAAEQLDRLPRTIRDRILRLLERLEKWPAVSGAKLLSGNLAGWYRLRTGDYRLRFFIREQIVIVDQIGHRKEFYES
jgi:mRNA interferase RelE/StbE